MAHGPSLFKVCFGGPSVGGGITEWPVCFPGPLDLPCFIRLMARARVSFQDWNLNWFVHLLFRVPSRCFSPAAAVCHLNNKCRWFPDLVRGAGLWCILILPHSVPRRGPSFIWIKEVEFKNAECFTWTQIASIYCAEWWNRLQFRPSPPWHRSFHHKSKKGFTFDPWRPVIFNIQKQGGISLLLSTDSSTQMDSEYLWIPDSDCCLIKLQLQF